MSTLVDAPSSRGWWLVPELAAAVVLALVTLPFAGDGSGGLKNQVALAAAEIVEQSSPTQSHLHDEDGPPAAQQTFCGVDVFGTDPPTVGALADVRVVYGYYFCASGSAGQPYGQSNRADGPIVVDLRTRVVQIAASGEGYADRVRAMMPDQYESRCFHGLPDERIAAAVRSRYEDAL